MKILFTTIFISFSCFKLFAQVDININCSAVYNNSIAYNTGEVFVIFDIQGENIVSRPGRETEEEVTENIEDISEEEVIDSEIKIFPNPSANIVYYESNNAEIKEIYLYDNYGKLILKQNLPTGQIDISNLSQGTYFLKTNISNTNYKIIKK